MVNGRASSPARSLRAKCQTQFVCGVSADSFAPVRAALANSNPRRATVRKLAALTISPREPRSGEFPPRRHPRARKSLNVVAGWIAARHSSVARREFARDVAKGTPGGTFANQ